MDGSASDSSEDCRSEPDALALEAGELNGVPTMSLVRSTSMSESSGFMDDIRDCDCLVSLCAAWREVKARSRSLWRTS